MMSADVTIGRPFFIPIHAIRDHHETHRTHEMITVSARWRDAVLDTSAGDEPAPETQRRRRSVGAGPWRIHPLV